MLAQHLNEGMNEPNMNSSNLFRTTSLVSGLGLALIGLATVVSAQTPPPSMAPAPAAPAAAMAPEKPWTGKPIPFADVKPILDKYCSDCHSGGTPQKTKGSIAFDTLANASKAGRSSKKPALTPGHVNASYLLTLVALPVSDSKHMPKSTAQGKPALALTSDEVSKLSDWIASGADFPAAMAAPAAPAAAAPAAPAKP